MEFETSTKDKIETFYDDLSSQWWDGNGLPKVMHITHEVMYPYIKDKIIQNINLTNEQVPFKNLNILDVGCGGGLLAERFAKDGATVTGIDINSKVITVAKEHSRLDSTIQNQITYLVESIEQHAEKEVSYDVVTLQYVLLHISNQKEFLSNCIKCLKPKGIIILATMNKTWTSWLYYKIIEEKILNFFPGYVNDWRLFTTPEDLTEILNKNGCKVKEIRGAYFSCLSNWMYWVNHTSLEYVALAIKN